MPSDAHAHLADDRLWPNLTDILHEAAANGLELILAAAAERRDWARLLSLAPACDGVALPIALGIHPWHCEDWNDDAATALRRLARDGRLAAIGEIGLDFQNGRDNASIQLAVLADQLQIATDCHLPVVLHVRKAWPDFFALLKRLRLPRLAGLCHNFSGSREIARAALAAGLSLSFGGPLTRPNARRQREAAALAPADRLLIESDAPDCAIAARNGSPGHPADILATAVELARLRDTTPDTLLDLTTANLRSLLAMDRI